MYLEVLSIPAIVIATAWFSLAWLLIGLLLGRTQLGQPTGAGARRRPRQRRRSSNSNDGGSSSGAVELYVGNLSYDVGDKEIKQGFSKFGEVLSVRIIKNRTTGKSKGFGFLEISDRDAATAAIREMSGNDFQGRRIVVKEAKSRPRAR